VNKDELTPSRGINSAGGGVCRACNAAADAKRRRENPDSYKEKDRRYYEKHRDKLRERKNRYNENNRDKYRAIRRATYHRNKHNGKNRAAQVKRDTQKRTATTTDAAELAMIQQFYAECPEGYQVDHVMPLALGGRHELANLQWLEESLNKAKGAKHPDDWDDPRPITCSP
jgi:hypothetical protein